MKTMKTDRILIVFLQLLLVLYCGGRNINLSPVQEKSYALNHPAGLSYDVPKHRNLPQRSDRATSELVEKIKKERGLTELSMRYASLTFGNSSYPFKLLTKYQSNQFLICCVQTGRILFIDRGIYESLSEALKNDIGKETILIEDMPNSDLGNNTLLPYTASTLAALLGRDLYQKPVIDAGAGSGALSLAALKLGASFVHSVEIDSGKLSNLRRNMQLNGYVEGVHFTGHLANLNETERLAAKIGTSAVPYTLISNIGYWEIYTVGNLESFELSEHLFIDSFIAGGYPTSSETDHSDIDRKTFESRGFHLTGMAYFIVPELATETMVLLLVHPKTEVNFRFQTPAVEKAL